MYEITEKDINNFFVKYYDNYYKKDNLIYDNIKVFKELIILIYKNLKEYVSNNKEETNWNKIKKASIVEYIPLITEFYKSINIDIDINELIKNGTIELIYRDMEELTKDNKEILNGTSKYEQGHKSVVLYNDGLITNSATLVHEISHYLNQPTISRGQINALFTESIAFVEELIYLDYLNDLGYNYESNIERKKITLTFLYRAADAYPLVKLHIVFNLLGEISKENYKMIYSYNDYENVINILKEIMNQNKKDISNFDKDIINNKEIMDKLNDEFISDLFYVLAAPLSIYMYEEYKKDNNFIKKIKLLNENINKKDIIGCLKTIGLTGYNEESLKKISKSFDDYNNYLNKVNKKNLPNK